MLECLKRRRNSYERKLDEGGAKIPKVEQERIRQELLCRHTAFENGDYFSDWATSAEIEETQCCQSSSSSCKGSYPLQSDDVGVMRRVPNATTALKVRRSTTSKLVYFVPSWFDK